jgi:two-component system, cell cycle sensor histidine kinase and response regulator CckA
VRTHGLSRRVAEELASHQHARALQRMWMMWTSRISPQLNVDFVLPATPPMATDQSRSVTARTRVPDVGDMRSTSRIPKVAQAVKQAADTLIALGDAVIVTAVDGRIAIWSSAAESVLGWSGADVIGQSFVDVLDPSPSDINVSNTTSLLTSSNWQGAAAMRHRTRGKINVHLALTQLSGRDIGDPNGACIILRVRPWPSRAQPGGADDLDPEVLQQALEHVEDLVLITASASADPSLARIVYVNEAFERTTGFRRDEVLGRSPAILRGPDTDRTASDRIDLAVRDRHRVREELLNYTKEGQPLWLDVDVIPVDGPGGQYMQWVALERDVTPQKGQDVALRAREERLRLALSAVWDGLWDWHVPTGYCYFAPRWYSMIGFVEHALPPHIDTFLDLLHPRDLAECEQALRDHFDGRTETYSLEVRLRTADNNWRWILTRGTVVERDAHDRPVRMVGTHTDISARKHAELALRTSEDRFRTLTMASPLGIFLTNAAGECTFVTPRLLDMWDSPAAAALGTGFLSIPHPDDRVRVADAWRTAVRDGSDLSMEYRILRANGELRWVHERTAADRDATGAVTGFVGTLEDITAQQLANIDRRRLEAQMQHAQKLESLGVLAGGIAHDFNNLLVGILGNASVAREEITAGTPTDELLADIETAAKRAAELTTQLLAYAGKGRFNIVPLDLSAAVRETSSLLQSAVSKRATLTMDLATDLPTIAADATQVRQVLMNLLTNASDALEDKPGDITLRTGVMRGDQEYLSHCLAADGVEAGDFVYVEVSDSGVGMDDDTISRIFDPFFTTKFTGRGLGLAATLGIVRGHRGALNVHSSPGAGTVFRVLFPAVATRLPTMQTPRSLLSIGRTGTILVVDDEDSVREVARRMLARSGYTVITASDGVEGLQRFAEHEGKIDVVVLDVTMPRMSGTEVVAELRRRGKTVPIVLASGFTPHALAPAEPGEVTPVFVQKPFVTGELLAGIDAALARLIADGV